VTPLEQAAQDYGFSFQTLYDLGDYFVVNVSSPNTPGLRSLQAPQQLEPILRNLQAKNRDSKPILVKIAPDLAFDDIAAVVDLAQTYKLAGIIATNTTTRREGLQTQILPKTGKPIIEEAGGISGAPVRSISTEIIRSIWQQTEGQLPIIGVGGIFTVEDAWEKITAGASLVQVYTGWTYEGPWMVKRILQGLLEKLDRHGLTEISQAVGLSHRSNISRYR
ncbi:MAG: dihydroorotate dehydrogenase (quinone), partial [Geitlerinemataceae cyanobacterium]